jgi:hypothetical protein
LVAASEDEPAEAERGRINMNGRLPSAFLILLSFSTVGFCQLRHSGDQRDTTPSQSCPVTVGQKSDVDPAEFFGSGSAHWENNLYVAGLWPDGTIVFRPNGPGYVYQDGSVGMKIAWYRGKGVRGKLKIQGRRLDAPAPPLRSHFLIMATQDFRLAK